MKKILSIISALYLTGCSVAKPLVLNNQINAPKQVLKAYTNLNTRNGANDFTFISGDRNFSGNPITVNGTNYIFSYLLYAMPRSNPEYSIISSNGTYYRYSTELMYNIKLGVRIFAESDGNYYSVFDQTYVMRLNNNHSQDFFAYHLPGDLESRQNPNGDIMTYVYQPVINLSFNMDPDNYMNIYVDCSQIYERILNAWLVNNNIYYQVRQINNITETDNYYAFDYLYTYNLGRDLEIINNGLSTSFYNFMCDSMGISSTNQTKTFTFDYNASFSEELSAYMDGYNNGLQDGMEGIGISRIRQVFRAIQAFLDFDFGFFKLGHLLGGILVIAIVIFVVRWFR